MEIYQTLQTIREMFVDRGHSPSQYDSVLNKYQITEISAITNAKSIFSIKLPDIKTTIIYVLSSKQRINDIKAHIEELDTADDMSFILVVREKFNNSDQKKLTAMGDFQVFQLSELQFNISKHDLVPKHELIKDEQDINAIIEAYQLKSRTQLPFILKTDAMARYLNAKPGNIVKITRISPSSGETIVYRCCV
jgi:DNA-directed RNA polymerase subunit H (RpoH/RPB5)